MGKRKCATCRKDEFEGLVERILHGEDEAHLPSGLSSKEVGIIGEAIAALYLRDRGYEILERNYRCPEGEADIIAFDPADDAVVLVEVKTRRAHAEGVPIFPEEAVNAKKRRRYRRIAACYLMDRFPVPAMRFDAVAVTLTDGCVAGVEHLSGAFDWDAEQ